MTHAEEIVKIARKAFNSGKTKSLEFREEQLQALLRLCEENGPRMAAALKHDLRKIDAGIKMEIGSIIIEVKTLLANFKNWSEPEVVSDVRIQHAFKAEARIYHDPYGVVLIVGPWNVPFMLCLRPLANAIAAGNCVVLKPSEVAAESSKVMEELIPKYLDNECYQVFAGGVPETTELLQQRFDYIFFTGSPTVGRIVHQAAAQHLTPTTLELGGKSPVYIDDTADIEMAVRRILWGKTTNTGQACIAPDYLLCSKQVEERFVEVAQKVLKLWYGEDAQKSTDYGRIINDNHFKRVVRLIDSGKIAYGGRSDPNDKFVEPTILVDVKPSDPIMQEEIFGPVLPIINVSTSEEAVSLINSKEKPLALYVFSKKQDVIDLILQSTSSGGVTVNDVIIHAFGDSMPYGGVGYSGMGACGGKLLFDTFVHKKSTVIRNFNEESEVAGSFRYPQYSEVKK